VKLAAQIGHLVIHGKVDGGRGTSVQYRCRRIDVLQGVRGTVEFLNKDWVAKDESSSKGRVTKITERQEVSDNVFVISTLDLDTNQFEISLENNRDATLAFSMDFNASINMRMMNGTPLNTYVEVEGHGYSEVFYLEKINAALEHELAVDVVVMGHLSVSKWKDYNNMFDSGSTAMVEECAEIEDGIFLHSGFLAVAPSTFEFSIENRRAEPVTLECIYANSINLRLESATETDTGSYTFHVHGNGTFSKVLTLAKVDRSAAHEINMSFRFVSTSPAPPLPLVASLSSELPQPPSKEEPVISTNIAAKTQVFKKHAGYVPSPQAFKEAKAEADCEVSAMLIDVHCFPYRVCMCIYCRCDTSELSDLPQ
jgi:hypothetical protein